MSGVNKVIILGNLGKDPEQRFTAAGGEISNITVATSESWNDKQSGEKQEKTEWHKVAAFGKLAEIMNKYLAKGSQVYIEGKIQTRKWQDKEGQDRWTTEIIANQLQMLGGKPEKPKADGFRDKPETTMSDFADDQIPF